MKQTASAQLLTLCGKTMNPPILILALALFFAGCAGPGSPGISYANARFSEEPVLIERDGHFYLRYRRALENSGMTLISVLYHKKAGDAFYYFFSVPISHIEWGQTVERPLAYDQAEEFARRGRVFWLDSDGTTHPIPTRKE